MFIAERQRTIASLLLSLDSMGCPRLSFTSLCDFRAGGRWRGGGARTTASRICRICCILTIGFPETPVEREGPIWQNPPRKGAATLDFGLSLYKHRSATPENLLFSPYSISIALAMLQVGAGGATRREIEAAIGHAGAGAANALWVQSDYQLNRGFVEACRSGLGAEVRNANFAEARIEAVQKVNEWIAEVTRDKILEILSESQVNPLTRVLLANGIYFTGPFLVDRCLCQKGTCPRFSCNLP